MTEKNLSIIDHLIQSHGIDLSKYEANFLDQSIKRRMSDSRCKTVKDYLIFIRDNVQEVACFIDSLQVSYTEFFRNALTFSVLEKMILPSLMAKTLHSKQNVIRIWSAACASGQETYSLAMLFHELTDGKGNKINFRIFATDQSERQIQEARKGRYTEMECGNLNLRRVERWFTKQGETFTIKPEIKENIDFSVFDLLNDSFSCPPSSIYGDFDLVICANLLFYYQADYRKKIIDKARQSVSRNGYLITGESEREILIQEGFREVYPLSGIFQR